MMAQTSVPVSTTVSLSDRSSGFRRVAPGPDVRPTRNRLEIHCLFKRKVITRYDWDWWTGHTGVEGTGKSTEAIWNAIYSDPTFMSDWRNRICYEAETFLRLIEQGKRGQSIILDEAAEAWFYKEWAQDIHQALDKASVQVRYKNLDIHLVTPSLGLLGKQAIRRLKDWCLVEAPNFERGHLEVWKPHWSKFGTYKTPFWEPRFYHRFRALPSHFYDEYKEFKIKAAEERMAKYIAVASGPQERKSMQEVVDEVVLKASRRRDLAKMVNERKNVDFVTLMYEYPGLGVEAARVASRKLTERLRKREARKDKSRSAIDAESRVDSSGADASGV